MAVNVKTTPVGDLLVATGRTLTQLDSMASSAASGVTALEGIVGNLENDLSALDTTVDSHTDDIGVLQTDVTTIQTTLGTHGTSITSIVSDVSALDTRIDALETIDHAAVTLAGESYLSLSGQQITAADINLATHTTGTLAIGSGGTGQTTASAAFNALKQAATTTATGVVELGTDGETTAGVVVQCNDSRLHVPVTVTGESYLSLSGQQINAVDINLTSHVTSTLPIANGGTGQTTAAAAFNGIKQEASTAATGVVELATDAEVQTGVDTTRAVTPASVKLYYQQTNANLSALGGVTSSANTLPYFTGSGTAAVSGLTAFARSLLDDDDNTTARGTLGLGTIATQASSNVSITGGSVSGIADIAIADGGTGASTAADAFAALKQPASTTATGVVELATNAEAQTGTDASRAVTPAAMAAAVPNVTLSGTPDYLTIDVGTQVVTRGLIDLATDVAGLLPASNLAGLVTETESSTSHTNAAGDKDKFLRWTSTSAKTYQINGGVAADGHIWNGMNVATTGNLTISAGAGVTLTGDLVFAPNKAYSIRFHSSTAADVIGGTAT